MALIKLKSNLSSKGKTVDYFDNENQTGFTSNRQQGDSTEFNRPVNSLFSTKGKVVDYFNNENQKGFTPDRQQGDPTEFKQPAESLYNDKIGGTNTTKNGTFKTNQRDNTEKNTQFTDDQVSAQHKKFKPDDDQFITHDIGDGYKGTNKDGGFTRGGFVLNTDRQVEDTKRLRKFLTTPKGFLFQTKQGILQKKNAREETRRYDRTSIIKNVDSVTEILDGNVSRAGEQRHRGGGYEETIRGKDFGGQSYFNKDIANSVHIDRPTDNEKYKTDPSGKPIINANNKFSSDLTPNTSLHQEGIVFSGQRGYTNRFGADYEGEGRFSGKPYEKSGKFFNVGQEEDVSGDRDTTAETVSARWQGRQDRIQGIKNAVAYLTPGDSRVYKAASFGGQDVKKKSIQVLYGGEFGKLNMIPTTDFDKKTNRTTLEDKSSNDFIKFRIRDAVNGKWIIFPALITGITDNSQANYNKIQYIGRPDSVHVYQNFNRSISFNLKVLATNENELGIVWQKVSALKGLTQPSFKPFFYDNKKIKSTGEKFTRPTAPYVYLTIGDMFKNTPGYFESVNVTIPEASSWEIIEGAQFPHMCDISCTFQYIGRELPATTSINYDGLKPGISGQNPVIRDVIPTGEFEGTI